MFFNELLKFLQSYTFVIQFVVVAFSFVMVLNYSFSDVKRSGRTIAVMLLNIAGVFILELLVNAALISLATYWRWLYGLNFFISHLIVAAIYCAVSGKYSKRNKFVMAAVLYVTIIDISELGARLPEYVQRDMGGGADNPYTCLFYLLILIFAFVLCKFSLKDFEDLSPSFVVLIGTIALSETALLYFYTAYHNVVGFERSIFYILVLIVLYVIMLVSYLTLRLLCIERREKWLSVEEQHRLKNINEMIGLSKQTIANMREVRHDLKNQIGTMSVLLSEKKYDELARYFSTFGVDVLDSISTVDCGNGDVSAVMSMELSKARALGVELDYTIKVPEKLPFAETDICSLFSNILDNAIEAVQRYGKKKVVFDAVFTGEYLYVSCSNYVGTGMTKRELLRLESSKGDRINHGIGHTIVDRIVKKYDGTIVYSIENDNFIVKAMLNRVIHCRAGNVHGEKNDL